MYKISFVVLITLLCVGTAHCQIIVEDADYVWDNLFSLPSNFQDISDRIIAESAFGIWDGIFIYPENILTISNSASDRIIVEYASTISTFGLVPYQGVAADTDIDGIMNGDDNCPLVPNPDQADLDEDSIGNLCDDDVDGDGVPNDQDSDDDNDGMPDDWESLYPGLNSYFNDADGDLDSDGLSNLVEFANQTNPELADSDGDGIIDLDELNHGNNPNGLDNVFLEVQGGDVLVSLTGNNTVFIELFNGFCIPKTIQFELSGLDSQWYNIAPEDVDFILPPFARKVISVQLHLPMDCGITTGSHGFEIAASWSHGGIDFISTDLGNLIITPNPNIYKLAIPEDTRLAGNNILVAWKTDIPTDSYLYYRKLGEEDYTQLSVATNAIEHRHMLTNLDWFTFYEFYTENHAACDGYFKNGPYLVKTGKAVKFFDGFNEFWIDRDYNQQVTLSITNTDLIEHTYQLSVVNDNDDLVVGFVGDGSNGRQASLQPGESIDVELVIHAPDTQKTLYDIYLKIVSDEGEFDAFVDYSHAIIHVRPFVANLDLIPVASTPGMMTYAFTLINYGDTLTDIEVYVDDDSVLTTWMDQEYHQLRLENGQSVPVVIHAQEHTTGTLYARSGSYVVSAPFEIGCPDGTNLNTYTLNDVPIVTQIRDWYCTNKERLHLPFSVPPGFGINDILSAFVEVNFSLPMALDKYDPHTVEIYINDHLITRMEDTIPSGLYRFRFPASFIHTGLKAPAQNYLTLVAQGVGSGQYIVATDFNIVLNVAEMEIDLCVPPPIIVCPLPQGCTPPDPETKIVNVGPKKKFRPGGTVPVTVTLHNDDNIEHQGQVVLTITNNSSNHEEETVTITEDVIIPPGPFAIPDALPEDAKAKYDYAIDPDEDDVEYTISVIFENFTLNETVSASNIPSFFVRTPLVILHGIMGSKMVEKLDGFPDDIVWGGLWDFLSYRLPDFHEGSFRKLSCDENGNPENALVAPTTAFYSFNGLERALIKSNYLIHENGSTTDFNLDTFQLRNNYSEDVFYFVYDWRLDNRYNSVYLREYINKITDQTITGSENTKINILAHSMGGLVLKYLFENFEDISNNKINKSIFVGTPNLGTVKAFSSLNYGDNDFGINKELYKELSLNISSLYQLLPSELYFGQYPNGYYTQLGSNDPINNYAGMEAISSELGFNMGLANIAKTFHQLIDDPNLNIPEQSFSIAGCKRCTEIGIVETLEKPVSIDGDGDKTVPLKSAMSVNVNKKFVAQYAEHSKLPSHEGVKRLVRSILKGYNDDLPLYGVHAVTDATYNDYCGLGGSKIIIKKTGGGPWGECDTCWPAIRITGCEGNHCFTGFTPNGIHIGILGSDYQITDEGVEIYVSEGSQYLLEFSGVDQEYLDIKFQLMAEGGVIKTYVFKDITLDINGCGEVTFNLTDVMTDPVLDIDYQCDGSYEQQDIPVDYVLDENESSDKFPPTTTVDVSGTLGSNDWYISDVNLTLNATDAGGSGLLATRYQYAGDATFVDYTGPIQITTPGVHTLNYYSIDRNLNKETIKTVTIKIDDGAPPQIISVLPPDQAYYVVPNSSFQIGFSEEMDTTLIDATTLTVSGSILGGYTGQYSFDTGTNTLSFIPNQDYLLGEEISVNISGNLTDLAGIGLDGNANGLSEGSTLDDFFWSFFITEMEGLKVQIADIDTFNCPSVNATVIVTDEDGTVVPDLTETNFSVYDNSHLRSNISVEYIDQSASPISISLALDYSGSMSDTANSDMESAAVEFVSAMGASDEGQVVKFANGVEVAQVYTTDKTMLTNAITTSTALSNSATHLYDALYQAITDTAVRSERKAVIAMTDGADNGSTHADLDVINYSNANGVPVFTIGLGDNINGSVLQAIADQTGGVYYEAPTSDDLQAIYQAISDVLKNQYTVTFTPEIYDGHMHTLHMVVIDEILAGSDTLDFLSCGTCMSDLNADADVDGHDLVAFINAYNEMLPEADLNTDGHINSEDIAIVASELGNSDCR